MVIVCQCAHAGTVPREALSAAMDAVGQAGCGAVVVPDLCALAALHGEKLRKWVDDGRPTILACRPRAVRWLLHRAGVDVNAAMPNLVDLREAGADAIANILPEADGQPVRHLTKTGDWPPWFPVIDYDRCRNCKQCLNFCLFGVYELDEAGRVSVAHPANCKNHCPACARICPDVAIMFPKLPPGEAPLDGADVTDETEQTARIKMDMEELLGDNVYAALEARKQKRKQRLLKRRALKQAEAERQACSTDSDTDDRRPPQGVA